jgi:hypothetical protein
MAAPRRRPDHTGRRDRRQRQADVRVHEGVVERIDGRDGDARRQQRPGPAIIGGGHQLHRRADRKGQESPVAQPEEEEEEQLAGQVAGQDERGEAQGEEIGVVVAAGGLASEIVQLEGPALEQPPGGELVDRIIDEVGEDVREAEQEEAAEQQAGREPQPVGRWRVRQAGLRRGDDVSSRPGIHLASPLRE